MLKAIGRIRHIGKAHTAFVTIPANLVDDSRYPFDRIKDEDIVLTIQGRKIIISKPTESDHGLRKRGRRASK
jgi:hypothetical protein